MNEDEICKQTVCSCLFDVLIRGNVDKDCVYDPDELLNPGERRCIKGNVKDYYNQDEGLDPERLVILSLSEKDTFIIGNYIYMKVLRLIYGDKDVFNTKSLGRFDMALYLKKWKNSTYLDFGEYVMYHKGEPLDRYECPPSIDDICHSYSNISEETASLICVLGRLDKAYNRFWYYVDIMLIVGDE